MQVTGIFIFLGLIGYMIVLIYVKWWYPVHTYDTVVCKQGDLNICTSPSIINIVIGDVMGLTGFAAANKEEYLWFSSQQTISNILVYITFICLPTMLCAIPCIHICCHKKHHDVIAEEF